MKTLTIKQPFASLIAEGYKEYEFRTWKTKYRGDILIHAGKSIDKEAMKRFEYLNLEYPTGKIIAKATITDCIEIDEKMKEKLKKLDERVYHGAITKQRDKNEYGFKLENVKKITPIEINGALSFWEFPY
ncbi:MAG: ASCH domain-containing protein [Bacilli bacterium]|nr:ASCH domain-containing protein [Bacilli bacterium]